jgi:hypothetical protein
MKLATAALVIAGCIADPAAGPDAGADADVPVACDGALCRTTNDSTCAAGDPVSGLGVVVALVGLRRRRPS